MPEFVTTIETCVGRILAHAGVDIRVAMPLGLGKPNLLFNALYRRVAADCGSRLTLYTALSLARPHAKSALEKRFLDPFLTRHFGDYPDLEYVAAQHANALPPNIRVHEFYLQSGAMLGVAQSQRDYISMNYTHVARDVVGARINVILQLIAVRSEAGERCYSLACNPDVTADLLDRIAAAGAPRPLVVGVVHADLPFIGNEAEVAAEFFDVVLDDPACRQPLFALPREPVDVAEFALGLHASTLVRDGGTLQIGIGALSDALVYALQLRQRNNADYRVAVAALGAGDNDLARQTGDLAPFQRGLYGASEMVMDGFKQLAEAGVLSRRVYDDFALEQALADGVIAETLPADAADRLRSCGALPALIDARELKRLMRFGLLPQSTQLTGDNLILPDGGTIPADLRAEAARAAWNRVLAGRRLRDGRYLRGAFYLGSKDFYAWLRGLRGDDFDGLSMTRVSDINQLYGGKETLDALQRRDARFFNTCMMATLLGASVSDALDTGQVVSGVGGQYNFVAMAHALEGGRSILMLRSGRNSRGRTHSNILWNYGHTTIPRHLRDVYVTEYGCADPRGKSDEDCIRAMLAITDARFQDGLAAQAQNDGKLHRDFAIPDRWRKNTPAHLAAALAPLQARGLFPQFPFGSDFSVEELALLPALQRLQRVSMSKPRLAAFLLSSLWSRPAPAAEPLLRRLGLDRPKGIGERMLRRLVSRALRT
ncbi:MAG: acetyl-CoA hydrolase/transferase C-terminal domain-containing protein [Rudaea sp.]|nr:acetyl-CoA hydrolase/transferase C-terminal domain-containing protein [Rudaea sp.]